MNQRHIPIPHLLAYGKFCQTTRAQLQETHESVKAQLKEMRKAGISPPVKRVTELTQPRIRRQRREGTGLLPQMDESQFDAKGEDQAHRKLPCTPRAYLAPIEETRCGLLAQIPEILSSNWRRGWDSNPRYACTHDGFQDRSIKPLWHPSGSGSWELEIGTWTSAFQLRIHYRFACGFGQGGRWRAGAGSPSPQPSPARGEFE